MTHSHSFSAKLVDAIAHPPEMNKLSKSTRNDESAQARNRETEKEEVMKASIESYSAIAAQRTTLSSGYEANLDLSVTRGDVTRGDRTAGGTNIRENVAPSVKGVGKWPLHREVPHVPRALNSTTLSSSSELLNVCRQESTNYGVKGDENCGRVL